MPDGTLLTLEDVAHRLRISYNQARILILHKQLIPYVKVGARGTRVKEEELEKYIKSLEKKEEDAGGNQDDISRRPKDTREPYLGNRILQGNKRRNKPIGDVKKDS